MAALVLLAAGCDKDSKAAKNVSEVADAPVNYVKTVTDEKKDLDKKVDVTALNHAIEQFQVQEGRYPKDLNELVTEHYLGVIPAAPHGSKLNYDAARGTVTVVPQ